MMSFRRKCCYLGIFICIYGLINIETISVTGHYTRGEMVWNDFSKNHMKALNCTPCNLSLNPTVQEGPKPTRVQCHYFPGGKCLSFHELANQSDDFWTPTAIQKGYQIYPLDVDVASLVRRIKKGQPVDQAPIYNPRTPLLITSNHICPADQLDSPKYDIIVIVKSPVHKFKERQVFREVHDRQSESSNLRVGIVFSLGVPKGSKRRQLQVFKSLAKEIEEYDDLLVGDFEEDYYNLTLKYTMSFRWAAKFCKAATPIFLFLDVDHGFNGALLADILFRTSIDKQQRFLGGFTDCKMPVHYRFNPWAVSKLQIPWPTHACYAYGFATIVGADIVEDISIAMGYTKEIQVDDIYMGYVVNKLGLQFTHMPNFHAQGTKLNNITKAVILPMKYLHYPNYQRYLKMAKFHF